MARNIRSNEVNRVADKLAVRECINKTDTVKQAWEKEHRRFDEAMHLAGRVRPLQDRTSASSLTGREADKHS
jgi:antitoxin VapB